MSKKERQLNKKLAAEFVGTFWLVLGGCGSAMLAASFGTSGIGLLGVSLAFGLAVLTGAYALGWISGAHFNPAVSIGLWAGGRFPGRHVPLYVLAQVVGGLAAAALLFQVGNGAEGFVIDHGQAGAFASNGYGDFSPGGYSLRAVILMEVTLTAMFVAVIMGATHRNAPAGFAPIAIGLALTLIHLISIPVSNTSVNPARSTAVAFFAGPEVLAQLWVFWCAPLLGAVIGGLAYSWIERRSD